MYMVPPEFSWEINMSSTVLVASALARARPIALADGPRRLNGLSDHAVSQRYDALSAAVCGHAASKPGALTSFTELEAEPPVSRFPSWESLVRRTGANDDPVVVGLARQVWEALGPNEYAVHLRMRPRTYRGFFEGRVWAGFGVLGVLVLAMLATEAQTRWGVAWWLWIPVILAWPALILIRFRKRYESLLRQGSKELPHL